MKPFPLHNRTQDKRIRHKDGFSYGWFTERVYRNIYYIIWGGNAEKVNRFLEGHLLVDAEFTDDCGAYHLSVQMKRGADEHNVQVIWLPTWSKNASSISILAHESFHCVANILLKRNINLINETDEIYCYLLEFIMEECVAILGQK